jgi:hypothetical protein
MSDIDLSELIAMLRAPRVYGTTGPDAADALERLQAANGKLERQLRAARKAGTEMVSLAIDSALEVVSEQLQPTDSK